MSIEKIAAKRTVTCGYADQHGNPKFLALLTTEVNKVPSELWAMLLAKKDSKGASPIGGFLDDGTLEWLNAPKAQEMHDGEIALPKDTLVIPPLQAAAQTYAETKSEDAAMEAAARSTVKEPPQPKRR